MRTLLAVSIVAVLGAGCAGRPAGPVTPERPGPETSEVLVRGVEYAFVDVPATIAPGETTLRLRNDGKEPHMIFFVRIEGTSKSLVQLMRLSERESGRFVENVGGIRKPVAPGDTGEATLVLDAGRYGYLCFISAPDGNAHYEKGMFGELEVTA